MMRVTTLLCAVLIMAVAGPAVAQQKKQTWGGNCGLTYNQPMGTAADYIEGSGGFACGVGFHPGGSRFGLLGEVGWSDFNVPKWDVETDVPGELARLSGHAEIWSATLNGVWRARSVGRLGFYAVGGVGAYRREVSVTSPIDYQYVVWCEPWWEICYVEGVPVRDVVASRSTTSIGYNLGVGVTMELGYVAELYVELRYTLIDSPRSTEYVPLAVGVRF